MDVPSWPLYSDALVFDELAEFTGNAHFCHAILFVASMPSVVVPLFCQPVHDHRHRVDFRCWTIMPWHSSFVFDWGCIECFFVGIEAPFTAKWWTLPLILCKCGHHFLKATWMNEVQTPWTTTCLQGFIFFKTPCTKFTARHHMQHAACVKNKLIYIITKNDYIRSYCNQILAAKLTLFTPKKTRN